MIPLKKKEISILHRICPLVIDRASGPMGTRSLINTVRLFIPSNFGRKKRRIYPLQKSKDRILGQIVLRRELRRKFSS